MVVIGDFVECPDRFYLRLVDFDGCLLEGYFKRLLNVANSAGQFQSFQSSLEGYGGFGLIDSVHETDEIPQSGSQRLYLICEHFLLRQMWIEDLLQIFVQRTPSFDTVPRRRPVFAFESTDDPKFA